LLIEIDGVRFLTDPGNYTTAQNDVNNIDVVVISHEHTDHLHMESLKIVLKNNPKTEVVCNSSVGNLLDAEKIVYTKISDGEVKTISGVELSGHGTEHAPIFKEQGLVENTGYFFNKKFFYPGDAFYNPGFPIDILAFPITAPWSKISESINYILEVKPRVVFPVHDGNVIRHGLSTQLPKRICEENDIRYISLELGVVTEV
jgi:L-ascorbate metabolism protein UlaG (beta-lactamase superfamily)